MKKRNWTRLVLNLLNKSVSQKRAAIGEIQCSGGLGDVPQQSKWAVRHQAGLTILQNFMKFALLAFSFKVLLFCVSVRVSRRRRPSYR